MINNLWNFVTSDDKQSVNIKHKTDMDLQTVNVLSNATTVTEK